MYTYDNKFETDVIAGQSITGKAYKPKTKSKNYKIEQTKEDAEKLEQEAKARQEQVESRAGESLAESRARVLFAFPLGKGPEDYADMTFDELRAIQRAAGIRHYAKIPRFSEWEAAMLAHLERRKAEKTKKELGIL